MALSNLRVRHRDSVIGGLAGSPVHWLQNMACAKWAVTALPSPRCSFHLPLSTPVSVNITSAGSRPSKKDSAYGER